MPLLWRVNGDGSTLPSERTSWKVGHPHGQSQTQDHETRRGFVKGDSFVEIVPIALSPSKGAEQIQQKRVVRQACPEPRRRAHHDRGLPPFALSLSKGAEPTSLWLT